MSLHPLLLFTPSSPLWSRPPSLLPGQLQPLPNRAALQPSPFQSILLTASCLSHPVGKYSLIPQNSWRLYKPGQEFQLWVREGSFRKQTKARVVIPGRKTSWAFRRAFSSLRLANTTVISYPGSLGPSSIYGLYSLKFFPFLVASSVNANRAMTSLHSPFGVCPA